MLSIILTLPLLSADNKGITNSRISLTKRICYLREARILRLTRSTSVVSKVDR